MFSIRSIMNLDKFSISVINFNYGQRLKEEKTLKSLLSPFDIVQEFKTFPSTERSEWPKGHSAL